MGHGFCPVQLPFPLVPLSRSQFYPRFVPSVFRASCLILPHPPSHPVPFVIKAASTPIFCLIWVSVNSNFLFDLGLSRPFAKSVPLSALQLQLLVAGKLVLTISTLIFLPVSSNVELNHCRAMMEPALCLLAVT